MIITYAVREPVFTIPPPRPVCAIIRYACNRSACRFVVTINRRDSSRPSRPMRRRVGVNTDSAAKGRVVSAHAARKNRVENIIVKRKKKIDEKKKKAVLLCFEKETERERYRQREREKINDCGGVVRLRH